MSTISDFPDEYLNQRLADRPVIDPGLRPILDKCLREWGGVSFEDATVGDMLQASRAVATVVVQRSPLAAVAMAGRENFTATELLRTMRTGGGKR